MNPPATSDPRPGGWLALLAAVFFLSGFTGLAFEVLWTRELSNFVGSTAVAMTCIFSVFIVCLALGSLVASSWTRTGRMALWAYAGVECAVGIAGYGLTRWLQDSADVAAWIPFGRGAGHVVNQLAVTFVIIGVPTTLMGMTMPLMINAIRVKHTPSKVVAWLYGSNVLGGACGAMACGFLIVWRLGVSGSALLLMLMNIGIALIALVIGARWPSGRLERVRTAPFRAAGAGYLALSALSGFLSLAYELSWGRLAKLYLGDRTMATATLLAVYLTFLALGSFVVGRRAAVGLRPCDRGLAASICRLLAWGGAAHLLGVIGLAAVLRWEPVQLWLAARIAPRILISVVLMCVPVTLMGMVFPLLLQGRRSVDQQPAQVVGWLYAVNAMAGAVGAVVGGIVFPRTVGTLQGFICLTGCAALGALGCGVAAKPKTRPRVLGEWAAAGGTIAALAWLFPSSLLHHPKAEAEVLRHEDEYGMQIVTRTAEGYLKVRNNQTFIAYKFGHPSTSFAQEMIAYVSGLLSQECRDVLNIGTGYGITAGAFTLFDGIQRLRTVEILPLVYERQDLFREKNYAYYEDPAVERLCTDGRRLLATETDTYDVISVNVLDPYVPGSSGLFTTNFWDLAKSRLKSGGVYSQLIWSRDRDVLMRGLETVFAEIYAFPAYRGAYNIVAFPGDPPGAFFMERLTPAIEQSLESMTERPARAFLDEIFAERAAWKRTKPLSKRSYLGALLHTDDTPILEYQWAHGNDRISMFDSLQAFDYE